jgi:hypothetical protein
MHYQPERAREILERTPAVLSALLDGLSDAWTTPNEGADTWSPRDVVAHLLGSERILWIPRMRHVIEKGEGVPFQPFDRTAEIVASPDRPLAEMLREFASLRAANLKEFATFKLSEDVLHKRGSHPDFGTVELHNLLATWVVHDLSHTAQIVRVMATQYRDDVGPWRTYLRVIR